MEKITNQMKWDAVFGFLFDRAASALPVLAEWIEGKKSECLDVLSGLAGDHNDDQAGGGIVAAAPVDLKDLIVRKLNALYVNASPKLKIVIKLFQQIVPYLTDEIWDYLMSLDQVEPKIGLGITKASHEHDDHLRGTDHTILKSGIPPAVHMSDAEFTNQIALQMIQAGCE